ncbi:PIN domain-containing protein [Patescibacteria group bacterium]|nr:PIN domain-containing protein [Patescibacteria group bacterium]
MKSLYLDSSIPSAYYEKAQFDRLEITQKWWEKNIHYYKVFTSELAQEEIEALKQEKKRELILSLISNFPKLKITDNIRKVAREYVEENIISAQDFNDALHLATASIYGIQIFLSWDFAHIVNREVERKLRAFNLISGFPCIHITTPAKSIKESSPSCECLLRQTSFDEELSWKEMTKNKNLL